MNFFKPTKLTFSVFILPILFSITPFLIWYEIIPTQSLQIPLLLGTFYNISIIWIFLILGVVGFSNIFQTSNIDIGRQISTGWIGYFEPSFVGWVIIIFANVFLYYLIGCILSHIFRSEKIRSIIFYVTIVVAILYVCLLVFYKEPYYKESMQPLTDPCEIECNSKTGNMYSDCLIKAQCDLYSTPSGKECHDSCDTEASDFEKQCNSQCLAQ